ncbi:MAG: alpha/beta hydrolase [Ferruginibacter sp.]
MIRVLFFALLIILITPACNNSQSAPLVADNKTSTQNRKIMDAKINGYAFINGIKLYYEIHGSEGMPLVLIHGGGSTIETTFGNILPSLAGHYKVIAVELQAHGRTSDRESDLSFEQDADDVTGLLKYLKIDKANFFGFSNGGNTSMQIAIRHPGVVNKLVIASSFYKRDGLIPGFFEGMKQASLENMPAPLKIAYLQVAPDRNHLQVMHNKDKERMLHFKDWSNEEMLSIKMPVLLIAGDHDVVTPEHAVEMLRILPQARLVILPGGHGGYIGEITTANKDSKIPGLTIALINEFLDEPPVKSN